ncbi:MAG: dynamin family protein [Cyanobacteria bacterium P01_A01_bin.80]
MSSSTFSRQKREVLSLFQKAIATAKKYDKKIIQQNLEEAEEYLLREKLVVVVAGECKQGKSSLINALLNEIDLFPVNVDITTNLVSTISYGEPEKIQVYFEQNQGQSKTIERTEIPQYVTEQENKNNNKQARILAIEAPNSQLKEGLIIADTPGVGGLNKNHTDISYALIPNADAVLFISDVIVPLSTDEIKFIEMIKRHCEHIIFIATKIDKNADYQSVIDNNLEKLSQVLGDSRDKIQIIPVSSYLKQVYLEHQDTEDLEDSNFPSLEKELWQFLNQKRGYILIMRSLTKLGQSLSEIKRPIQAEWEAYQKNTQEELNKMEQEFSSARENLQNLQSNNASWRTKLSDGLGDIRSKIQTQLQEGFLKIRRCSEEYLDNNQLLKEPEQIANLLEVEMDALMNDLGKELSFLSAELNNHLESVTGLNMNPFNSDSLAWQKPKFTPRESSVNKSGWWDKSLNTMAGGAFKAGIAGTIGAILGGAVGSLFGGVGAVPGTAIGDVLGTSMGAIAGFTSGAKQSLAQMKEREKSQVLKLLRDYLEESQLTCRTSLNDGIKNLERFMRDELIGKLQLEQENCTQVLESINNARKLSDKEAKQKAKTLKLPLQELDRLLDNTEKLAKTVLEQQELLSEELDEESDVDSDYGDFADE